VTARSRAKSAVTATATVAAAMAVAEEIVVDMVAAAAVAAAVIVVDMVAIVAVAVMTVEATVPDGKRCMRKHSTSLSAPPSHQLWCRTQRQASTCRRENRGERANVGPRMSISRNEIEVQDRPLATAFAVLLKGTFDAPRPCMVKKKTNQKEQDVFGVTCPFFGEMIPHLPENGRVSGGPHLLKIQILQYYYDYYF